MSRKDFTQQQLSALDALAWDRANEDARWYFPPDRPEQVSAKAIELHNRYFNEYVGEAP